MKALFESFKTTALGGVLFLVPTTVAGMVIIEVLDVLEVITEPLAQMMGASTFLGVASANVIGLVIIGVICFLVGLFARARAGQNIVEKVEKGLLSALPGYTILKGVIDTMVGSEKMASRFKPVLLRGMVSSRLAYEVERTPTGNVVVFVPGAPNPFSGSVHYADPSRVEPVDMPAQELPRILQQLGIGSGQYGLPAAGGASDLDLDDL